MASFLGVTAWHIQNESRLEERGGRVPEFGGFLQFGIGVVYHHLQFSRRETFAIGEHLLRLFQA